MDYSSFQIEENSAQLEALESQWVTQNAALKVLVDVYVNQNQCSPELLEAIVNMTEKTEKEDEEDNVMALDEDYHSHETTHKNEVMEAIPTNNVLVKSEDNGISHETRREKKHNMEILEKTPPLEYDNTKMVEEDVESQVMIKNLDDEDPDLLGIEEFMQPRCHGIPKVHTWKLNEYLVKTPHILKR
ncbi:hypothetical protein CCACVL1_30357 [Corchorus capsularis]|uniref:Uncharacterized protein n=1 Tax=Corchorus capsularis TaxID=210143 RepID=A0A1R3FXN5_COCAP|nr:hypothetical protein CCACVL1_30357 [Corchorus capsularis]